MFYLDFISTNETAKNTRSNKSNDQLKEAKSANRQPPKSRKEKFVYEFRLIRILKF